MKRFALLVLLAMLAVPTAEAGRKSKKAGKLKDAVFIDERYGFELTVHENWKAKVQKDDDDFRLVLTQKSYGIPPDYQRVPDYTKVPKLIVYASKSEMGPFPFLDSLMSESYESSRKKDILREFEFLQESDIVPMGRRRAEVGGESGVLWKGKSKYVKDIQESAGSVSGKRVYGAYGGAIIVTRKDETIVLFHVMAEWQFFESVMSEVMTMIASFEWSEGQSEGS